MYNKHRRTYEREVNQTGIPSWRREEGRGKGKRRQVSTGAHPGDAAGTPSLPNHGPEIHRDRIPRHSKPGFQRSFSRLCLELTSWPLPGAMPPITCYQSQAASRKLQRFKLQATSFKRVTQSFKLQAASDKLQDAGAFIKFCIKRRGTGN